MIKKWLLGIGVFLFGSLSFSYGYQLLTVGDFPIQSNWSSNYDISVLKRGRFLSQYLGYGKRVLALSNKNFIFWSSDGLYLYDYTNDPLQGYFQYYYACDEINLSTGGNYLQNCSNPIKFDLLDPIISNFINTLQNGDYLYINRSTETVSCGAYCSYGRLRFDICYSSKSVGSTMCFIGGDNFMGGSALGGDRVYHYRLTNSLSLRSDLTFGNIPDDIILDPPYYVIDNFDPDITDTFNDSGNTVSLDLDIDNTIWYFENTFGWDEKMCYVGTYDTGSVYGSPGINFIRGYGNTIYGLYHSIYGSFGNNKIQNVGSFVDTWLLNYGTWFQTVSDERLFVADYHGPDQNVTYIYTGFTFPFANKPVAIYFMADLLANEYIKEESQGEMIVYYCDLKLNYDNYKNGSLNFNDTENLVDKKLKDRIKYNIDYRLGGTDGYSVPGSGSLWGSIVKTGYNIPKDLNPTNLFKDFYDKINGIVSNFHPARDIGIIPWWILYPMLFLILFRILRH